MRGEAGKLMGYAKIKTSGFSRAYSKTKTIKIINRCRGGGSLLLPIVTTLLGKRYSWVEVASIALELVSTGLSKLEAYIYNQTVKRYEITPEYNSKYAKFIGSIFEALFYKKYGLLKARGLIDDFSRGTNSRVYFNYETKCYTNYAGEKIMAFSYKSDIY